MAYMFMMPYILRDNSMMRGISSGFESRGMWVDECVLD
jgi:hypothetical protein